MTLVILVAAATVGISSICSLLEATLYSAQPATLEAARNRGGRRARAAQRMLALKHDVTAPTSAILIVNTIANTAGATLVGVLAVRAFGDSALVPVSIGLTVAILLLAEIMPKTYAATHWRRLWPAATWMLTALVTMLSPALRLVDAVMGLMATRARDAGVPKDEIRAMVRMGRRSGVIDATEAELLDATLALGHQRLGDIAVRPPRVVTLAPDATADDAVGEILTSLHTRYPLCRDDLDECVGLVHAKDLLAARPGTPLSSLARFIERIDADTPLQDALRLMQAAHLHMVLVHDAGRVVGVATLEDVLERVVGPVMDEFDSDKDGPRRPRRRRGPRYPLHK